MSCSKSRVLTRARIVKVEENGRVAAFLNKSGGDFFKVNLDGGLVKNQTCADYAVVKKGVGTVVVELKGTDIEHAVDQIAAAIRLLKNCGDRGESARVAVSKMPLAGLIICSRYPRVDSMYQRRLKKFVKENKCPLHCVSGKGEFEVERVLSFKGPR